MSTLTPNDLSRCRVVIDDLDRRIIALLNERTTVVEQIGRIKEELKMGIYEPKREDQVLENVLSHNSGPLPPESVKRIFERIMDEMRTLQKMKLNNGHSEN
jgi:chorismate mutase-like protein